MTIRYALTIFLSAFLLFQVQPMIAKVILPWFGGTPAVWTTCMLFFQAVLLAGYSYAHVVTSRITPRGQTMVHIAAILVSLFALVTIIDLPGSEAWKPADETKPIGGILVLLAGTIGLPYFVLSTTGPLMQEGYRRETGHPPYRLYALSNIGSLAALFTYPLLFEPFFTLKLQTQTWTIAYCVFAAFCGWCALGLSKGSSIVPGAATPGTASADEKRPSVGDILLWICLAACGSSVLLATTNQLCQEVSSVPFLWVLPLSLYLLTFIICFDHERWYYRPAFIVLLVVAVIGAAWALEQGTGLQMRLQVAIFCGVMFVCCMVCHGELTRSKPAPRYATLFYLMVSLGGVVGGVLVGIGAPMLLNDFYEYQISMGATIVLAIVAIVSHEPVGTPMLPASTQWLLLGMVVVALGLSLGWFVTKSFKSSDSELLVTTRNFYGVLHVSEHTNDNDPDDQWRTLTHGRITHGIQYRDDRKRNWATTYYGHPSGVGIAIDAHPRRKKNEPMRIGVVGLGTGTLAVYGQDRDMVRFYEINPEAIRLSDEYFTYRKDSPATVEVVLGDARIKMEREIANNDSQQFDVLAIDAFSSDAIPMHLLTLESVKLYMSELKPDGILCLHISNRFLRLAPVVRAIAEKLDIPCVLIESDGDDDGLNHATWVLLTHNKEFLESAEVVDNVDEWDEDDPAPVLWTDDWASMWHVIDWK